MFLQFSRKQSTKTSPFISSSNISVCQAFYKGTRINIYEICIEKRFSWCSSFNSSTDTISPMKVTFTRISCRLCTSLSTRGSTLIYKKADKILLLIPSSESLPLSINDRYKLIFSLLQNLCIY